MILRTNLLALAAVVYSLVAVAPALADDYKDGLAQVTTAILMKVEAAGLKSGTVLDFADLQGASSELGRYVAQDLADNLVSNANTFQLLDRTNLQQLLKENKLTADGLVDPSTSQGLGKLVGIDTVIVGTLTLIATNTAHVSVRAIALATGRIVASVSVDVALSETLAELAKHGVGSSTNDAATSTGSSLRDRLSADSIKLVGKELMIRGYGGGVLQYSVENHSGVGLSVGVVGSYSAGPCPTPTDDGTTGLPLVYDRQIGALNDDPSAVQNLTYLPNKGRTTGTLGFWTDCGPSAVKGLKTTSASVTLLLSDKHEVVLLPITADTIPIRIVN